MTLVDLTRRVLGTMPSYTGIYRLQWGVWELYTADTPGPRKYVERCIGARACTVGVVVGSCHTNPCPAGMQYDACMINA